MKKQVKVEHAPSWVVMPVFDRAVLAYHTMDDASLAQEILTLFVDQLNRLEAVDWAEFDVAFEMHPLRGAAAAVGALQIEAIAGDWRAQGAGLEAAARVAIKQFRIAAKA